MTAPDLLPCPFCDTDKVAVCQTERTDPVFWVECIRCNAKTQPSPDKAEAIAAWNTRATPAAMTPEVRALVEAAEDLIGQMDMSDNDDPDNAGWELYTYAGKFRRLAKALAALRAGGDA